MNAGAPLRIFEDDLVCLEHADFCRLPGYLVLRLKNGVQSLAQLGSDDAGRLGVALSAAAAAIETVVGADRVYCLSFCELDRRLHFHLFPRSPKLLVEYHRSTNTQAEPVNGPMLFEWAREAFAVGAEAPAGFPTVESVSIRLREMLGSLRRGGNS